MTSPPKDLKKASSALPAIGEHPWRARARIGNGEVTGSDMNVLRTLHGVLNETLATELVYVRRHKRHRYKAKGIRSHSVAAEYLEHAVKQQVRVDRIAERITRLDEDPYFNPEDAPTRRPSEYVEGETIPEMIREDLIAELIAIASDSEIIHYLADTNPTGRRMLDAIFAKEDKHVEDTKIALKAIGKGEEIMKTSTRDEIKGKIHEVKGKVREKAGQVTNNPDLEADGQAEALAGKVQKKVGQIEKVFEK